MGTRVGLGIGVATLVSFGLFAGKSLVITPRVAAQSAPEVPVLAESPPKVPPPKSCFAPRFFLVTKVDERQIALEECTLELAKDGISPVFNVVHFETRWEDLKAFEAAGNTRSADWLKKHVKVGDMVLVAADNQPVAPVYRRLLRPDAVILLGLWQAIWPHRP